MQSALGAAISDWDLVEGFKAQGSSLGASRDSLRNLPRYRVVSWTQIILGRVRNSGAVTLQTNSPVPRVNRLKPLDQYHLVMSEWYLQLVAESSNLELGSFSDSVLVRGWCCAWPENPVSASMGAEAKPEAPGNWTIHSWTRYRGLNLDQVENGVVLT